MRYLLIILLAGLTVAGCSKNDRELINGKWTITSIGNNGEVLYTTDKSAQEKIVDRIVEKQMKTVAEGAQTSEQKEILYKVYEQHMKELGKMTLVIKEDDSFVFNSYNGSGMEATNGTLTFDEDRHLLQLKSNIDEKFTYRVTENELILVANEGGGSTKLTFKR